MKIKLRQKINKILLSIIKYSILFFICGLSYYFIEIIFRGYSHWSMIIDGGLCGVLIGGLNNWYPWNLSILKQMGISAIIITVIEYISGYILNIKLGWDIWDYSDLPININGQVCLLFTIVWFFLSLVAIVLDDCIRYALFNEDFPHYTLL